MSYVSHDGLAYFKHKLDQKFISNISSEDGALKVILGDGTVLKNIQDTTVTQKKSTANELYPLLLCYDAMADQDQLSKETWFGQHILANPYYGYLASRGMYVKHPTFNRRNGVSQKVEWAYDFTDAVSGLGNPMSQVYAYVDPASEGGEHCIELRLYGNPNVSPTVPSVNDSTNTFSIGVGVTGGNVQFGYCPSTPLYLDDGSTLRTEATGHGNDIITRDWLNLNGSLTGLVHTTMNETIDGAKTFKKTVTINSGDSNNKADLYVQGNSTVDGKLTANGTAEIKGGSGNTPSLTVTGDERITGNSTISGNETVTGKITGNNGAEINGGNGLIVNGNETVNGEIYKLINNTPQEYVSYVTNKQETKTTIVNNLIKDKGGLAVDSNKSIYVNTGKGLNLDSSGKINVDFSQLPAQDVTNIITGMVAPGSGLVADSSTGKLAVDFASMPTDKFEAMLADLKMLVPLTSDLYLHVNNTHANKGNSLINNRGTENLPFETIQACIDYFSKKYSLGSNNVYIFVHPGTYNEAITLRTYSTNGGTCWLTSSDQNNKPVINYTGNPGSTHTIGVGNSQWNLRWLKIVNNAYDNGYSPTSSQLFPSLVYVNDTNGQAIIRGCECEFNCTDVGDNSRLFMMMFAGNIAFYPDSSATTLKYHKGNAGFMSVLHADGAYISRHGTTLTSDHVVDVACQGDCSVFANALHSGYISARGAGPRFIKFVVASGKTCTGKKYSVVAGSGVENNDGSDYPGDVEGTVESSTYSWYRE